MVPEGNLEVRVSGTDSGMRKHRPVLWVSSSSKRPPCTGQPSGGDCDRMRMGLGKNGTDLGSVFHGEGRVPAAEVGAAP